MFCPCLALACDTFFFKEPSSWGWGGLRRGLRWPEGWGLGERGQRRPADR